MWTWLVLACAGSFAGVALPLATRLCICAVIAFQGIRVIRRDAWLLGPRAVRVVDWSGAGWTLGLGPERRSLPATPVGAGLRAGTWLILRFRSAEGIHPVYVDGGRQDERAFRRLSRRLRFTAPAASRARFTR